MCAEPLLSVRGVEKRFGGLTALDGVSLGVARGSITGLIGPNGAGKTTLFDVVSGLLPPDAGEIRLGADRLEGRAAHEIARLGVARTFQIPRPLARLTVLENLLLYGKDQRGEQLRGLVARRAAIAAQEGALRTRALEILALTDLVTLRDAPGARSRAGRRSCWSWRASSWRTPR